MFLSGFRVLSNAQWPATLQLYLRYKDIRNQSWGYIFLDKNISEVGSVYRNSEYGIDLQRKRILIIEIIGFRVLCWKNIITSFWGEGWFWLFIIISIMYASENLHLTLITRQDLSVVRTYLLINLRTTIHVKYNWFHPRNWIAGLFSDLRPPVSHGHIWSCYL